MIKYTLGMFAALLVSGAAQAAGWYGEQAYLACNPDVAQALRNGQITGAYDHYIKFGQFENRITDGSCNAARPGPGRGDGRGPGRGDGWDNGRGNGRGDGWDNGRGNGRGPGWGNGRGPGRPGRPDFRFDEREYLRCNPDVARAVRRGQMPSGWVHYQQFGRRENRRLSC